MPHTRTLILGSGSPMRRELLHEAGLSALVVHPPWADPDDPETLSAEGMDLPGGRAATTALAMARGKFASVQPHDLPRGITPDQAVLLCADTVAQTPDGRLRGKPADANEARAMLTEMMGTRHDIVTAVALGVPGRTPSAWTDAASVSVGPIDGEELERYLASEGWRGKAGGYSLRARLQAGWSIRVDGDPTTVMGLPMQRLVPVLRELGVGRGAAEQKTCAPQAEPTG